MTFHPNMESHVEGVSPVDGLRWRAWSGMLADVWDVECRAGAHGQYVSPAPRLFVMLETESDAAIDLMVHPQAPQRMTFDRRNPMCFIPAGLPVWSSMGTLGHLRHLDIHLDVPALASRFGSRFDLAALNAASFSFRDERVLALARLIALECCEPGDLDALYADSLAAALLTALGKVSREPENPASGLAPRRLNRVLDHMSRNCSRNLSLAELAAVAGLSTSHFAQAFKASMGMPPHRWQMAQRIERVKALLEEGHVSVTDAALAAGFADQSHLTRAFRRFEGTTPGAWLRQRLG
ncbi:AraC family transcriptional regulator [Pannonibacter phragmitetus]|uniref:AraC family transcriptional regulator n=1 Tax=Pannonibacter phragmitetus TaxID=121719 RepID=UPI000F01392A|nr:AraC family transcriptional regulator [Pannonibacter phragmitetus]